MAFFAFAHVALFGLLQSIHADRSEGHESAQSMEVRASPHSFAYNRRHDVADMREEQREQALQRQLELTREERGEAEFLQASEQQEAARLAHKLEYSVENEERAREKLREARRELAANRKEVSRQRHELHELRSLEAKTLAEQRAAEEARQRYNEKFKKARHAQAVAERQRKLSLAEEKELANEEYAAVLKERRKASKAMKVAQDAEEQRQAHFKAAVAMRQETEEAQAIVEQAAGEKAAAQREKSLAMWTKQQAKRDSQTMSTLAFVSWGLLVLVLLGVLGSSIEVQKLEVLGLQPLKLFNHLHSCLLLHHRHLAFGDGNISDPEPVTVAPPVAAEDEAEDDVQKLDLAAHDTDTD